MLLQTHMFLYTLMRLASILPKADAGGETSLGSGPLSVFLGSVVPTSQHVQSLVRMVSFIILPLLVPTTLATSSASSMPWTTQHSQRPEQSRFVVVWDSVSFHWAALVHNRFTDLLWVLELYLPPYSRFLSPTEEFFFGEEKMEGLQSATPPETPPFLQVMEGCADTDVGSYQGWVCHSRWFFACCLAWENITCDVDEVLWCQTQTGHTMHPNLSFSSQ